MASDVRAGEVVTLRKLQATSCSLWPLGGESPMKRITAVEITPKFYTHALVLMMIESVAMT